MKLNPYLFFEGNCADAFRFYRSVFGGDFEAHLTFAEAPSEMEIDDQYKDQIMHVSLPVGDSTLSGSDIADKPLDHGANVAVSCHPDSIEEGDRIYAALSEGGEVQFPIQKTFWGSYFGACRDRFGVEWQVNVALQQ